MARGVEIGRGYIAIDTEDGPARAALRSFASVAKEAFKATAVAAGLVAGAAAKIGVEFNSMKEQAEVAFTTLLGSGEKAKGLLEDLQKFSAQTPFEMEGLIENARGLLGVGVEAQKVIPTLTALGNAAGALGLNQEAFNRIMLATTQSMAKGKIQGEELLQFAENGIPIFDLLGKALGVPKDQIAELGSQGKLLSAEVFPKLFAQMQKDYGGAMAAQSKTLAGTWSSLKDNARILAGTGFRPLFDEAKRVTGALGEFAASDRARQFAENFADKLDLALKKTRAFAQELRVSLNGEYADALTAARLRAERFWDSFKDIAGNGLKAMKNILREIAPEVSEFVGQFGGYLPAVLESVNRVMQSVADNSTELGQALASALSVVNSVAGPALALFRAALEATAAVLSSVIKLVGSMPDGIGTMVGVLATAVIGWRLLGGSAADAMKTLTMFSASGSIANGIKAFAGKIDDAALSAGVLTERLTGSSKAAGKVIDAGTGISGAFRGLAGSLPAIGGALAVVGALLAVYLVQQNQITAGAEKLARGLSEGGQKARDAASSYGALQRELAGLKKRQQELIEQQEKSQNFSYVAEDTGGELQKVNEAVFDLERRVGKVNSEFNSLTENMGSVEKAQANYNRAVAEFGPYSDQATQASALWRAALADEKLKNEQAAQATKTHIDKLLELQNVQLGILNADIGYRQALAQQEAAQLRASEALTIYGSESVQYRDALLQNESAIEGVINAAGRKAVADNAGRSESEQTTAAIRAQNAEALRLAQAMGTSAPASLQKFISNMNGAELAALGVTGKVNAAGHAILVMPDGKEIRIQGDNAHAMSKINEVNNAHVRDKYVKLYVDQITRVDQRVSEGLGGRAIGGPIRAATPYLVGERGPELIFPDRSGYVATAAQTRGLMSGGSAWPTSFVLESGALEILDDGLVRIVSGVVTAANEQTASAIANRRGF